jgi:uncharacterized RDD family membrane protein YckC
MNRSSELRIRTPEGIVFAYALASPVTRCLAWAVDLIAIFILVIGAIRLAGVIALLDRDLLIALYIVGYFLISTGYGIAMEWLWRGQTFGKRFLGLRVADAQGFRLQFHQVLLRNLVRPVDSLPLFYLVGGLACLLSRRAQRLGDLVAGTIVVHTAKYVEPDLEQLLAGKYNSLREHPHLAARLRQHLSSSEARLALQALLRRGELDPDARIALFAELAGHFKAVVSFPPEAVEAMPDEQYVRNVVDILFRTRTSPDPRARPALAGRGAEALPG